MKKKIDFDYIDIHSHILPGIDDGARDLDMSLAMIQTAYQEGIRAIVATPHYHPAKCRMHYEELLEHFEDFKKKIKEYCPEMELFLGREVYYTSDLLEELEEDSMFMIGRSHIILVEYDPTVDYSYLRTSINNLIQMGYTPLIAHVERYLCMVEEWQRTEELVSMGALIQINQASVIGETGRPIRKFVKRLLKEQLVHAVGTDAHSNGRRSPVLNKCAEYIYKKYGYDYARQILRDNAARIIQGDFLEV